MPYAQLVYSNHSVLYNAAQIFPKSGANLWNAVTVTGPKNNNVVTLNVDRLLNEPDGVTDDDDSLVRCWWFSMFSISA